jgi:hypothetical protein
MLRLDAKAEMQAAPRAVRARTPGDVATEDRRDVDAARKALVDPEP